MQVFIFTEYTVLSKHTAFSYLYVVLFSKKYKNVKKYVDNSEHFRLNSLHY